MLHGCRLMEALSHAIAEHPQWWSAADAKRHWVVSETCPIFVEKYYIVLLYSTYTVYMLHHFTFHIQVVWSLIFCTSGVMKIHKQQKYIMYIFIYIHMMCAADIDKMHSLPFGNRTLPANPPCIFICLILSPFTIFYNIIIIIDYILLYIQNKRAREKEREREEWYTEFLRKSWGFVRSPRYPRSPAQDTRRMTFCWPFWASHVTAALRCGATS